MDRGDIMNKCLYCNKEIALIRIDSLGRKLTKGTKYCCKDHRNRHIKESNKDFYKNYYAEYYKANPEKYKIKTVEV